MLKKKVQIKAVYLNTVITYTSTNFFLHDEQFLINLVKFEFHFM